MYRWKLMTIIILILMPIALNEKPSTAEIIRPYTDHGEAVRWINGTETAVTLGDNIFVWNVTEGTPIISYRLPSGDGPLWRRMLAVNLNGTMIVAGTSNGGITRWKFTNDTQDSVDINVTISALAWGDNIYVGTNESETSRVLVFDPVNLTRIKEWETGSYVETLDATADGKVAAGLHNGTVMVWKGGKLEKLNFGDRIRDVRWNGGDLFIAEWKNVHIYSDGALENIELPRIAMAVAPSDDSQKFAAGYANETIDIFDRNGNRQLRFFQNLDQRIPEGMPTRIFSMDWNQDKIIVGRQAFNVPIFDANTGEVVKVIAKDPEYSKYVIILSDPPKTEDAPIPFWVIAFPVLLTAWRKTRKINRNQNNIPQKSIY